MAHLGLICPELSGHLNPMTTLGRELKRRGHRVTLIGRPDAQKKTESAGLEFAVIGEKEFPVGSLTQTTAQLGRLGGLNAIRFTAELLRRAAVTLLDQASGAIATAGVDALLADQVTPAGETVAEMLGLPFVSVCNALALGPDPALPPAVTPWRYHRGTIWRWRNTLGDSLLRLAARPIIREINARRLRYGLSQLVARFLRLQALPKSPSSRHFRFSA
jgi:zeaxanthin glucosyltransferase